MGRRIHLVAPGGGAACGAHNLDKRAYESEILATLLLALVDCKKCARTDHYKQILNPSRQYQLRLFQTVKNTAPPPRLGPADISADLIFHRVAVFLDGEPQPDFVAYDIAKGWVERYRRVGGQYVVEGNTFATERVAGVVTTAWKRAA